MPMITAKKRSQANLCCEGIPSVWSYTACTKLRTIWNHYTSKRVRVHVATIKILLARIVEHALDTTHAVRLRVMSLHSFSLGLQKNFLQFFYQSGEMSREMGG